MSSNLSNKIVSKYGTISIKKASQDLPYSLDKKFFKSKEDRGLLNDFKNIVKKYYPNCDDAFVSNLYTGLSELGCTYASIANVIIEQLGLDNDSFKKIFGYSIYRNDGSFDSNKLMIDIYSCIANMVELRINIYEKREFDNYLVAAKELLGHDYKTDNEALMALVADSDSKWILNGISKDNKLILKSKKCVNKSFIGTYSNIAKQIFEIDNPDISRRELEVLLEKAGYGFKFYYDEVYSKLSGLGSVKVKNLQMWINKFFEVNNIDLNLEVENINNSNLNYNEFVEYIINKQNEGYSIEVSSTLKSETWMTDGKVWEKPTSDKAGHQMNFEGFDEKGNIVICSWGKTYMFPKEFYKNLEFMSLMVVPSKREIEKGRKSR